MFRFRRASEYSRQRFGGRVQKIPVDGGFSCPNRDGTLSSAGCIYCSNRSFSPFYVGNGDSITEQLQAGIAFYRHRYDCERFLAYFQTYSGTWAPVETLEKRYLEALQIPGVEGLVIATRPDCVDETIAGLLADLAKKTYLRIELGVESFDDRVLQAVNRCHNVATTFKALQLLKKAGIETCIHLIFGLPGEDPCSPEMSAEIVSETGAILVKLHHLQVIAGTALAGALERQEISLQLHGLDSFLEVVARFVSHLPPSIYLERFINRVPPEYLIAPRWGGITEAEFQTRLNELLRSYGYCQGIKFSSD